MGAQAALKTIGNHKVFPLKLMHCFDAHSKKSRVNSHPQDIEHILDTCLAVCSKPPKVSTPDHDRPGAQSDRLDDIAATPDTPVE